MNHTWRTRVNDFILLLMGAALLFAIVKGAYYVEHNEDQIDTIAERNYLLDVVAYQNHILLFSAEYGLDPAIVVLVDNRSHQLWGVGDEATWRFMHHPDLLTKRMLSIIAVESGGRIDALGDNGRAHGLTQIWLTTAQMYDAEVTSEELMDPITNVNLSLAHYIDLLEKNRGDDLLATLAWNYGNQGALDVIAGRKRLNDYVEQVLSHPLEGD